MIQNTPLATSFVSSGSQRRFAKFNASLPPSTKNWIKHQAKIEGLQPVYNIPFMRATIRRHFPKLSSANIEALLAVMVLEMLQPANESDMGQISQMNLQMQVDQRAKLLDALSNIMKSIDNTQSSIVQNMK